MNSNFRPGDRVRVTPKPFEGTVDHLGPERLMQVRRAENVINTFGPDYADVELIERGPFTYESNLRADGHSTMSFHRVGGDVHIRIKHRGEDGYNVAVVDESDIRDVAEALIEFAPSAHGFEPSFSGMVCGRMVMRDGGGDSCGKTASDPVHKVNL